jgi:hypothetical protein
MYTTIMNWMMKTSSDSKLAAKEVIYRRKYGNMSVHDSLSPVFRLRLRHWCEICLYFDSEREYNLFVGAGELTPRKGETVLRGSGGSICRGTKRESAGLDTAKYTI